ncbi:gamma-glutamylcyclotransferase [Labrenzia sp. PHM005]|uniref:gamma-glutamylcyclotransferase family protein n=1 Tax=Labrenzia sp. PHM005 TaxID=2590016 RepID=UPI00113FD97E|nr:gamma-glutamylcyclotransferase [Labrenzia sp. PHM005]QDG77773.1 gamma-glutamylcyclotransferase [Labrenzia sp. PHM005]
MTEEVTAEHRLATYGTLAPGRVNHHHLEDLQGEWTSGVIRGRLVEAGWGAELGYPGLVLDPAEGPIDVHLLTSKDLVDHWERLDAFEGSGYLRVSVDVETPAGCVSASIYVISNETDA